MWETIAITGNEFLKEQIAMWLVMNGISGQIKPVNGHVIIQVQHYDVDRCESFVPKDCYPYQPRQLIVHPEYQVYKPTMYANRI